MKKAGYLLLAVIVVAAAAGIGYWKFTGNPDALRQIVLQQCLPHQLQQQDPAPCAEVKPDAGYVVFKDRNGPLQYLLMPTWRINGTESPLLLKSGTPNFFWLAWQARSFMSQKYGHPSYYPHPSDGADRCGDDESVQGRLIPPRSHRPPAKSPPPASGRVVMYVWSFRRFSRCRPYSR